MRALAVAAAVAVLGLAGGGCGSVPSVNPLDIKSFLDPTEMFPNTALTLQKPILPNLSPIDPSIDEPEDQFYNAQDPRAEDKLAVPQDYKIGKGDTVSIVTDDVGGAGVQGGKVSRVTEGGMVSVQLIGPIKAVGLTEEELQEAIKRKYRELSILNDANVTVSVIDARARTFSTLGAWGIGAGEQQIPRSDFRVLDALVQARDVATTVDTIYIIRQVTEDPSAAGKKGADDAPTKPAPGADPSILSPTGHSRAGLPTERYAVAAAAGQPVYLQAAVSPGGPGAPTVPGQAGAPAPRALNGTPGGVGTPVAPGSVSPSTNIPGPGYVPSRNGSGINSTGTFPGNPGGGGFGGGGGIGGGGIGGAAPAGVGGGGGVGATGGSTTGSGPDGFQFNTTIPPSETRTIRVPVNALRNGDLTYNIVIRPHDLLVAPQPVGGVYYLGGHIGRPGAFGLAGDRVTLKQAVISAGMLDGLAIPQRTELWRRIGPAREVMVRLDLDKIFSGIEPDIYLKPNDVVQIGTNVLAPFIAAVRGGFRITYGFGFLYDRNFGN